MKKGADRAIVLILFLLTQLEAVAGCDDRQILRYCFQVWEAGAYGRDSSGREAAAWIIRRTDRFSCRKWPATNARKRQVWERPKPEAAVAILHTHPAGLDPKPSTGDVLLAKRIRAEVFSISRQGIWKVNPDGEVTCEAGAEWYRDLEVNTTDSCE